MKYLALLLLSGCASTGVVAPKQPLPYGSICNVGTTCDQADIKQLRSFGWRR